MVCGVCELSQVKSKPNGAKFSATKKGRAQLRRPAMRAAAIFLACVASVAAYSAKTHLYRTTDLWHDADVPSLRPVAQTQSPAARQTALLAAQDEDPDRTTYCIADPHQNAVDDKWCFVSCSNLPPNCPPELCDCVKGREAKKKVDKVKEQLKKEQDKKSEEAAEVRKKLKQVKLSLIHI